MRKSPSATHKPVRQLGYCVITHWAKADDQVVPLVFRLICTRSSAGNACSKICREAQHVPPRKSALLVPQSKQFKNQMFLELNISQGEFISFCSSRLLSA
jgi:hypothetical protein